LKADRPLLMLVSARWWPLSARLAAALLRHGCRVEAVCPAQHPITRVRGIGRVHPYAGVDSLASLRRALLEARPDRVIPCDDGCAAQLHELHRREPALRALIERSLGPARSLDIVSSRFASLRAAADAGITVPLTIRIDSRDDLVAWHSHVATTGVMKVNGSCGGEGVRVCRTLAESVAAWQELRAGTTSAFAWKRLLIDRDPLALWVHSSQRQPEITVQRFVSGRPANSMLACRDGKVLSQVVVSVVASGGAMGAATVIRPMHNAAIERAGERLAQALQLSGFVGLDFMIEDGTDEPYFIEINPRCTQLGHLELAGRGSLAGAYCADLLGQTASTPQAIVAETIALFPQAQSSALGRSYIDAAHHDVPWDEPDLVRELLARPWPQRQWASRIYHALRSPSRPEDVAYEAIMPRIGETQSPV